MLELRNYIGKFTRKTIPVETGEWFWSRVNSISTFYKDVKGNKGNEKSFLTMDHGN